MDGLKVMYPFWNIWLMILVASNPSTSGMLISMNTKSIGSFGGAWFIRLSKFSPPLGCLFRSSTCLIASFPLWACRMFLISQNVRSSWFRLIMLKGVSSTISTLIDRFWLRARLQFYFLNEHSNTCWLTTAELTGKLCTSMLVRDCLSSEFWGTSSIPLPDWLNFLLFSNTFLYAGGRCSVPDWL